MLTRFRQWRWMVGLLVVLSPPVAGTIVPWIDPCPVDMPWLLAEKSSGHQGHDAHAAHADPAPDDGSHDGHSNCHCVGACAGAASLEVPPAGGVLAAVAETSFRPSGAAAAPGHVSRPRFLHPLSHAPPVA